MQSDRSLILRDFFLDALAADASSKQWLVDIDKERDELRTSVSKILGDDVLSDLTAQQEAKLQQWTEAPKTDKDFNDATRKLHLLSQKWLSISQDTEDFQSQLKFLRDSNKTFAKRFNCWQNDQGADLDDSFKTLQSQSEICMRWTKTYRSRTEVCINLVSRNIISAMRT